MSNHRTWAEIIAADPAHSRRYANRWRTFAREGRDIHGEARLIDAMVPRSARVLDAGCGQGRVGGHLSGAGHSVVGVDIDPYLIGEARSQHPMATWLVGDLKGVGSLLADDVAKNGAFDAIVAAGNVLTFIDPKDRMQVLTGLASVLGDNARAVFGFGSGRGWEFSQFEQDVHEAGMEIRMKFSTWDLRPFDATSNFLVAVCEKA
ncbi:MULTISPECIES: class I SAM-dependent methyltransferase [unclassified Corynebacterium]|uniref:class I SAM-dependent methyltransferase n=1 Tax=unclassified Corynebacterium TaxID=2624378 RepID=UPI0030AE0241